MSASHFDDVLLQINRWQSKRNVKFIKRRVASMLSTAVLTLRYLPCNNYVQLGS